MVQWMKRIEAKAIEDSLYEVGVEFRSFEPRQMSFEIYWSLVVH
jgi:hypothetical protein